MRIVGLLVAASLAACTPSPEPMDAGRDAPAPDGGDGGVIDGGDLTDVAPLDGGAPLDLAPPRAIAPLSGNQVTTRRPTFRWELAAETDGAAIEISPNADFSGSVVMLYGEPGSTSLTSTTDVPAGLWYWRLRSYVESGFGAEASPAWTVLGAVTSTAVDSSWPAHLDFDRDGLADFAVSSPTAGSSNGAIYVMRGAATLVPPTESFRFGDAADQNIGAALAGAGDVNGDGYGDLISGDGGYLSAESLYKGSAVYVGGPTGLSASAFFSESESSAGSRNSLRSVAGLGDVDGDGYGDVAVGTDRAGTVVVHRGGPTGMGEAETVFDSADAFAMMSVLGAGDVDGDGLGDLALVETITSDEQYLRVYRGSAAGIAATPVLDERRSTVAMVSGDVDGDGRSDLVVAEGIASGATGAVDVYLGTPTGLAESAAWSLAGLDVLRMALTDLNGDGRDDLVVSEWDGTTHVFGSTGTGFAERGFTLSGLEGHGHALGTPGDVDGDGLSDLVLSVPARGAAPDGFRGSVLVFRGPLESATPFATLAPIDDPDFGRAVAGAR